MRSPRIYHEGVSDWYIQPSNITHYMNLSYNTLFGGFRTVVDLY